MERKNADFPYTPQPCTNLYLTPLQHFTVVLNLQGCILRELPAVAAHDARTPEAD